MQPLATLVTPPPLTFCRLGRDGTRLFVTREAGDGSVLAEVWDVPAQRLRFATSVEAGPDLCWADASPDMKVVFAVTPKGEARATLTLWDVASGQAAFSLATGRAPRQSAVEPDVSGILWAVFSADGSRLVTAGVDGTVGLWDPASGQEVLNLALHPDGVWAVGFSPDGSRLVSGGMDGTIRVYALRLEELVALARQRLTRSLTDDECRRYLHLDACPPAP
jgi:WD40 repeat protein